MTVTLELSAAEEAELLKKAEEKGLPLEKMLRDVALGIIAEPGEGVVPLSAAEFDKRISAFQKFLPKDLGSIPEEALRREHLYADEDELRTE
jgi:hypothetical protein